MSHPASLNRETSKRRVLKKYPKAYAVYVGLSLKIVVRKGYKRGDLSGHFTRERDAWADADRGIRAHSRSKS